MSAFILRSFVYTSRLLERFNFNSDDYDTIKWSLVLAYMYVSIAIIAAYIIIPSE